jgi:hypothetical protein
MPKPTGTIPEWAIDPVNPTDLVAPTSTMIDEGWNAAYRPPSQVFNWLFNKYGQWIKYINGRISSEELVYETPPARLVALGLGSGVSPGGGWSVDNELYESEADGAYLYFPLLIPSGCTITGIKAAVFAGSSRATEADRLELRLGRTNCNFTTMTGPPSVQDLGDPVYDNGTSDYQLITLADTIAVTRTTQPHFVSLKAGTPHGGDQVFGIQVAFTDPGPRNF